MKTKILLACALALLLLAMALGWASSSEERASLSSVSVDIKYAQDTHQIWLDWLLKNPQWLLDHPDTVKLLPALFDPEWHRRWVKVYGDTLYYLKQVKE